MAAGLCVATVVFVTGADSVFICAVERLRCTVSPPNDCAAAGGRLLIVICTSCMPSVPKGVQHGSSAWTMSIADARARGGSHRWSLRTAHQQSKERLGVGGERADLHHPASVRELVASRDVVAQVVRGGSLLCGAICVGSILRQLPHRLAKHPRLRFASTLMRRHNVAQGIVSRNAMRGRTASKEAGNVRKGVVRRVGTSRQLAGSAIQCRPAQATERDGAWQGVACVEDVQQYVSKLQSSRCMTSSCSIRTKCFVQRGKHFLKQISPGSNGKMRSLMC